MDGGLSNNQPILDEKTIKISPFAGASHICPRDKSDAESTSSSDAAFETTTAVVPVGEESKMKANSAASSVAAAAATKKPASKGKWPKSYNFC